MTPIVAVGISILLRLPFLFAGGVPFMADSRFAPGSDPCQGRHGHHPYHNRRLNNIVFQRPPMAKPVRTEIGP